ncbi:MAG TPA: hypothetical protein VHC97_06965 [Thermoanaerobaculia bacterium]|jgi:hypothetical protein|nr:hypothetical protein [Thermoanaerobaculia bacterium]
MTRSRTYRRLAVAALILVLLLPSAAGAREPWTLLHSAGERNVFVALWDLVSQVFQGGSEKHRGQIDPDGLTGTVAEPDNDNRGQMDPNG